MAQSTKLYSVHPSVKMVQDAIAQLKTKTGRTMDEWIKFINKEGPDGVARRRDWLKKEHGLGTNYASWIAGWSAGEGDEDGDPKKYLAAAVKYVEEMYSGKKAALKPLHDRLITLGRSMGKDVKVCPCRTMVPLFREHVFAQIKPSTNTRIDFGLALGRFVKEKRGKIPARLIDTGGLEKKDRITHRFAITVLDHVDDEVGKWLRIAYEMDAGE
jgi:hypothetical protein